MAVSGLSRHASLLRPYVCSFVKQINGGAGSVRTMKLWVNTIFNQVDKERIKKVGADRACAEWLVQCGAAVKWKDQHQWQRNYNFLPCANFECFKIEEIDATNSAVMADGFLHLSGLMYVQRITLDSCCYMHDEAIPHLSHLKESLVFLQLTNCGQITDKGLDTLKNLKKLKRLKLYSLPKVQDREKALNMLNSYLPDCDVTFTETMVPDKKDVMVPEEKDTMVPEEKEQCAMVPEEKEQCASESTDTRL